jgi:hypothetical protein
MNKLLLIPDEIGGLPTHPLIVHFVVILLPLAVIAFIATGWREEWRRNYALPVVLLAIAAVIAAFIATMTGEELRDDIREAARAAGTARPNFGDHPEDGELARNVAIVFALIAAGFWALVQWGERIKPPSWAPTAAYVLGCLVGVVALFTVISAGHSGSALVWKDLGNFVSSK